MTDRMDICQFRYLSSAHSHELNIHSMVLEEIMALRDQQHNGTEPHCTQM